MADPHVHTHTTSIYAMPHATLLTQILLDVEQCVKARQEIELMPWTPEAKQAHRAIIAQLESRIQFTREEILRRLQQCPET